MPTCASGLATGAAAGAAEAPRANVIPRTKIVAKCIVLYTAMKTGLRI